MQLKRWVRFVALTLSGLTLNCASTTREGPVPASTLPLRIQHQGFSASRPPSDDWFLNRHEQDEKTLVYRRVEPDKDRSSFIQVALQAFPRIPQSNEDFDLLVREAVTGPSQSDGTEVLSVEMEPRALQGQYCVRYRVKSVNRGSRTESAQTLYLHDEGMICQHPAGLGSILFALYSVRETSPDPDAQLQREAEDFLRGLVLDVAPGVPAPSDAEVDQARPTSLPQVSDPRRVPSCAELVGFWQLMPLDDPSVNEVEPWPLPYQWFGILPDGYFVSMMTNEPGSFSAEQLEHIIAPVKGRSPTYRCRKHFLIVSYPFADLNEMWAMSRFKRRAGLFKPAPFEEGEVVLRLMNRDASRTVYRRRLRRVPDGR